MVDAAIGIFKVTTAKEMTDAGSESWSKAVSSAIAAYNANSNSAPMNSSPEKVKGTPVLQWDMESVV